MSEAARPADEEVNLDRLDVDAQILTGTRQAQKDYRFDEQHPHDRPAEFWFQESHEGEILFVVFYTQACRWSRCLGCNLPSRMSQHHVSFKSVMAQIDCLFADPAVVERYETLNKVIVSNNGSVLDEQTFSSTALMYLIARLNLHLPRLEVLSLETRVEYVDMEELEFIARALKEGETPTVLEVAVGFEAFDDRIRNQIFNKGLTLESFERLCHMLVSHDFHLKCYFMQKPVAGMSDEEAILDIHHAIAYMHQQSRRCGIQINMHLNPTYVACGTRLAESFRKGEYQTPRLEDVARAALAAEGKDVSIFLGLSDEGLACEGGSFLKPGEEWLVELLERFNRTQDYELLRREVLDRAPTS